MGTPKLLTLAVCAERTGIPEGTYRWWHHVGHTGPKFSKIGRRLYVAEDELNAWVENQLKAAQ